MLLLQLHQIFSLLASPGGKVALLLLFGLHFVIPFFIAVMSVEGFGPKAVGFKGKLRVSMSLLGRAIICSLVTVSLSIIAIRYSEVMPASVMHADAHSLRLHLQAISILLGPPMLGSLIMLWQCSRLAKLGFFRKVTYQD